jgi:hypothetical protein
VVGSSLIIVLKSMRSIEIGVSEVVSATKSCALSGMKMTVWVASGAKSKSVVERVAKHAGYVRTEGEVPSGHSVGAIVGEVVGPDVGEVVGPNVGPEVTGDSVGIGVGSRVGREVTGGLVGDGVGSRVGPDVGEVVGWTVGSASQSTMASPQGSIPIHS